MKKLLSLTTLFIILFTGCSSKQYFEPEDTFNLQQNVIELDSSIISLNSNGATLENENFISSSGIVDNKTKKSYFLNFVNGTTISTDNNAKVYLQNNDTTKSFSFSKNIISASKHNNLLAFGSIDNSITLFDMDTKKILFKEYLKPSSINNTKIANPIFLNTVVLYPTLDGKIVIVDLKQKVVAKTINIDPNNDVNNIIFLKEVQNILIAATSNKLFTFVNGKVNLKDIDIQSIIVNKNNIYVATLDGEIAKYDFLLNKTAFKKFKFAKINALAFGTYLYALESQNFLIRIDENFKTAKVFDFSFDNEEKVIGIDNKIYTNDAYIVLD